MTAAPGPALDPAPVAPGPVPRPSPDAGTESPRRRTLFWHLSLLFMAVLALASIAHGLTTGRAIRGLLHEAQVHVFTREAERFAAELPGVIGATGRGEEARALQAWLDRAAAGFPELSVVVYSELGARVAAFRPPHWLPEDEDALEARSQRDRPPVRPGVPAVVRREVAHGGQSFRIYVTLERPSGAVLRERSPLAWAWPFAIWFATSALAGILGLRVLTARFRRLEAGVRRLADGELATRVEPGPDDEVGHLIRSVNSMAERLEKAMAEVSDQARARRDMLADVAHELRTPLTTLSGHLELLADELGPAKVAVLSRETAALRERIEDLLTLARDEAGALPIAREPVNLQQLLSELVETYRPLCADRGLSLTTSFSPEILRVAGDRSRLKQVFRNLLDNALAITPGPGTVEIGVEAEGTEVRVQVDDSGPGIDPEELPRLFERFVRGRRGPGGGTGLGLALVRRLTEAHQGRVEVGSAPGLGGARFTVRLPRLPDG